MRDSDGGGRKVETLPLYILAAVGSRSGGQISSQNEIHTVAQYVKQMIPSFTSFPSQPPQRESEASPSSSQHKPSKKDRRRSRERTRGDDESGGRGYRRKQKHRHRDRDDPKEDERQGTSTTFFSDYIGNRAHGGGTDLIRVPKYNLVARTSHPDRDKYN